MASPETVNAELKKGEAAIAELRAGIDAVKGFVDSSHLAGLTTPGKEIERVFNSLSTIMAAMRGQDSSKVANRRRSSAF